MRQAAAFLAVFSALVCAAAPAAFPDSTYKSLTWKSRLENGELWVQGAGPFAWGSLWTLVDSGVSSYEEAATSKGPVLVYRKGGLWHAAHLHFSNGAVMNPRTFKSRPLISSAEKNFVILRVDGACYRYNWLRYEKMPCE